MSNTNWRTLEAELIDILRRLGAPLDDIEGEAWIVDFDLQGNPYGRINVSELARALDERGITYLPKPTANPQAKQSMTKRLAKEIGR